jgi:hypothetical protein
MRKLLGVLALVLMAVLVASPADASDKGGKKISKAQLQNINWGRRSDVKTQYWPYRLYPSVKIY